MLDYLAAELRIDYLLKNSKCYFCDKPRVLREPVEQRHRGAHDNQQAKPDYDTRAVPEGYRRFRRQVRSRRIAQLPVAPSAPEAEDVIALATTWAGLQRITTMG